MDQIYEIFEMIGQGTFSFVYKAKFIPTGKIIAVKVSPSTFHPQLMKFVCFF